MHAADFEPELPGGLQVAENGDLIADDQGASVAYAFAPPSFTTLVSTTPFNGVRDPVTIGLARGDSEIWTADAGDSIATLFGYVGWLSERHADWSQRPGRHRGVAEWGAAVTRSQG